MTDPSRESLLSLKSFGAAFGDMLILAEVDLEIAPREISLLIGPAGAGKSTLLRTLAGFNDAQPSFRTWGEATYDRQPLGLVSRPALVAQNARLVMSSVFDNVVIGLPDRSSLTQLEQRERAAALFDSYGHPELARRLDESVVNLPLTLQRAVAIIRTASSSPALLLVDEPTAGLDEEGRDLILELLLRQASERALLVVTHNQRVARMLGGRITLLAGGRVQESASTLTFLSAPSSRAGHAYVETGSCSVPSPSASRESLDPDAEPPPALPAAATQAAPHRGPRGFHWLVRGSLAGTPRPGLLADVDHDLQGLRDVGVTVLVTLEETRTVPAPQLARYRMTGVFFPIDDMCAPLIQDGITHCKVVEKLIAMGEVVCLHCRAGHGRTGVMLAAQLVWRGEAALDAVESARRVQPKWIQSDAQIEFLVSFADAVRRMRADTSSPSRAPTAGHAGHQGEPDVA